MNKHNKKMRVAAIGDLHVSTSTNGEFAGLFAEISEKADILLLAGDLTQIGETDEAETLVKELASLKIPSLAVLGNHEYQSNKQDEIKKILSDGGVYVLDGSYYVYKDVGFAGVKGFGGGFENMMLQSWGENIIKEFVLETVNEVLKLENALSKIEVEKKVVLLHYAPIPDTIEGEPEEIYPFLGSSRFAESINLYKATAVFHGHAHIGKEKGETFKKVPVYNVTYPLLKKLKPNQPYQLVEI